MAHFLILFHPVYFRVYSDDCYFICTFVIPTLFKRENLSLIRDYSLGIAKDSLSNCLRVNSLRVVAILLSHDDMMVPEWHWAGIVSNSRNKTLPLAVLLINALLWNTLF